MIYLIYNLIYKHPYNIKLLIISIILMMPTTIDGITQYFGPRESTNKIRFITGVIGGIGLIIFIKIILRWIINVL